MKTNLLLQLHEKAAKTIEAIAWAEARRKGHLSDIEFYAEQKSLAFESVNQWHTKRAEVNAAIAERLKLSYKNILNKINQHQ